VRVIKIGETYYLHIPRDIVYSERIYEDTQFNVAVESYGRLIYQRIQHVTPAPEGSVWRLMRAK